MRVVIVHLRDSSRDLMVYKDKNICPKCLKELKNN